MQGVFRGFLLGSDEYADARVRNLGVDLLNGCLLGRVLSAAKEIICIHAFSYIFVYKGRQQHNDDRMGLCDFL